MVRIRENLDRLQNRALVLLWAVVFVLVLLGGSLIQFQILDGERWARLAVNNRLRKFPVPTTRGRIFDRSGVVLADSVPSWRLLLFPDEVDDLDTTLLFLHRMGVGSVIELRERHRSRRLGTMAPLVLAENLEWEQVARIRSRQIDFPELAVVEGFRRVYPHGPALAHVLGHLRYVSQEDLETHPEWSSDRLVGAIGVEALAEERVAARDGERWVVASAAGKQLGVVNEIPGTPGTDLAVTLDLKLQRAAVTALGDRAGAIVVLDPTNGAVRALYSSPSFDPNIFSAPLSPEVWGVPCPPTPACRCRTDVSRERIPRDPPSSRFSFWPVWPNRPWIRRGRSTAPGDPPSTTPASGAGTVVDTGAWDWFAL
jgi:penicillin-binding protein 2